MQSKMKCPSELRGLRPRTEEGVKFCFSYNLGKDCSTNCTYAHQCMRCGHAKCWAQVCFLLKQNDYEESWDTSWESSHHEPRHDTTAGNPSSSSKDNQISSLTKQVEELQQRVGKMEFFLRDYAKTVRRMEQTLLRHNLNLNDLHEISRSDLDWPVNFGCDLNLDDKPQ